MLQLCIPVFGYLPLRGQVIGSSHMQQAATAVASAPNGNVTATLRMHDATLTRSQLDAGWSSTLRVGLALGDGVVRV